MLKYFRIAVCVCLVGWMLLIFCLSAETADASSATSGGVIYRLLNIFYPKFDTLSEIEQFALRDSLQFLVRKTAHFIIYAILGVLSFLSIVTYKNLPLWGRSLLAAAFCLLYSISDEIHQLSIPGRSGEIRDVFIDFCGALLGITVLSLIVKLCKFKFIKKYT